MKKVFERFPEGHPSHIPLKIGYECGLRLGEVFALCWEDVDFVNKIIKVNRQVQWMEDCDRNTLDKISKNGTAECGNGYWYFSLPKYKCRFIEISDSLSSLLLREKERQLKAKEFYEDCFTFYIAEYSLSLDIMSTRIGINKISKGIGHNSVDLVCKRQDGTFISPRTMQYVSRVIKKDIFSAFDFHSLRHTHASMLAENGVEPKYIQTRLGH